MVVGYAKDQWLKELEQGYSTIRSDKAVCDECFEDEAIQQFVRDLRYLKGELS